MAAHRYIVHNNNTPSPGTVTEEKRSELEEFADSAELILGVLGYKAFVPIANSNGASILPETLAPEVQATEPAVAENGLIPPLPDESLKIGEYVYTAMTNLSLAGYSFADDEINAMCTPEWSKRVFHTKKPFMKRYIPGQTDNKGTDGYVRFKSAPYTYGTVQVLVSKEWYESQREYFKDWYATLT